ncbi:flagellar motor protein MotB [Paenibacillus ginsengihumi]|uniref:flagellar motor protein MotB n=1 Tax=Paenibacillus ginsengihumi TaxID=431596 RepID=UPI00036D6FE9|nr:flagellar motor protein MotB [Paenibacillus ginsengihumi]
MRKKQHRQAHHEEHIDESWLIPYADLLTLLLALFIILFASSQVDSKKFDQIMKSLNAAFTGGTSFFEIFKSTPIEMEQPDFGQTEMDRVSSQLAVEADQQAAWEKEMQDLSELKAQIDLYIQENQLSTQLETELNRNMLVLRIRDHALFESGSATVKSDSRQLAQAIGNMLSEYPEYPVEVAGHTDNVPIRNSTFPSNWDLSSSRALNFMKIMMQNENLDPARFRTIGYGEYKPIDSNDTEEGRSRNRRVEVSILHNVKFDE